MTAVYHRRGGSNDWETPASVFDPLDLEFCFSLDAAASHENRKCEFYCTEEGTYMAGGTRITRDNGLEKDWSPYKTVWLNPPYSKWQVWVEKAATEAARGALVVALLPARTDTKAFHRYIWPFRDVEVRFVKGRITFVGAPNPAPFPSMVVVFRPRLVGNPPPLEDNIFMRNALVARWRLGDTGEEGSLV